MPQEQCGKIAMMAMTTSNSISVNALLRPAAAAFRMIEAQSYWFSIGIPLNR